MLATHRPAPTLCTPKGECKPFVFVALQGPVATPGPKTPAPQATPGAPHLIVQTLRPFGLVCGCSLAVALPGCAGSATLLLAKEGRGQPKNDDAVRRPDPVCTLGFLPPGSRADSLPARLSLCALCRGAPQSEALEALHRLRCGHVQGPGACKALFPGTSASAAQVRAPRPHVSNPRVLPRRVRFPRANLVDVRI